MRNQGYIIVTVAGLLVVLLGFTALAVDLGVLYSARTSAQRAADAAALAGAFTFVADPTSPQPATASDQATQTALTNSILGTSVQPAEVSVSVNNRIVTVNVMRTEPTFIAGVLGVSAATVHARADAEASPGATSSYCVKPWFIPNTMLSTQLPCTACGNGQVIISNGQLTTFAKSQVGTQFAVKPQDPKNALGPGQFFAVQLPGDTGGNDYRNEIGICTSTVVGCQQSYSVKTGNMTGPTKQGVSDLIGNPPRDTFIAVGRYRHADGTVSDTSTALVVAPIWDTCSMTGFCPSNTFPSGTNASVKVAGFALIFLEGVQGNNVIARFIGASGCGNGGLPPGETGPYAVPVRLVRPTS